MLFYPRINSRQKITYISIAVIFIAMLFLYGFLHYAREDFSYRLRNIPQNALNYVDPKNKNALLISADEQQQLSTRYLQHYFSPWNNDANKDALAYKSTNQQIIKEYIRYPGYGINHLFSSV